MIHFRREKVDAELAIEIGPSLEEYHATSSPFPEIPLAVRWEQYYWMEQEGVYRFYAGRDDEADNIIVAYSGYIVSSPMQHDGVLAAGHDVLYVHPDYRRDGIGKEMIICVEKALANEGVEIIEQHVSVRFKYDKMLLEMDYELTDRVYRRRLSQWESQQH